MEFTKQIGVGYESILASKINNFKRRSLWRYLIASILVTIVYPNLLENFVFTGIAIFLGLCLLSFIVIYMSARILSRKKHFQANMILNDEGVQFVGLDNEFDTIQIPWQELEYFKVKDTKAMFSHKEIPGKNVILKKEKLTKEEYQFLEEKEKKI